MAIRPDAPSASSMASCERNSAPFIALDAAGPLAARASGPSASKSMLAINICPIPALTSSEYGEPILAAPSTKFTGASNAAAL